MISLATKYRPSKLEDVVGQSVTVDILRYQIEKEILAGALGFFGASGCGKTTIARIVSNMINDNKGHPIEIDAASNNSVDDVRNIIEGASQRSLDSKYKVYIIDECHAISSQGWQAFLKLLEEPNKYTKFIFCTTNPEKIPDTVISRLQTFTFTKISDEQIVDRLRYICRAEELELDDNSLKFITRISNGSMRQSIANLEKCTKTSKIVSYEEVVKIAGSSNYDLMIELFKSIYNKNDKIAVSIVENVYKSGKDLKLFVFEFLKFILDLSKAKIFENNLSITSLPDTQQIRELFAFSSKFNEILENVVEFYESIRQSNEIRFMFESKLILWCAQN